MKRRMFLHILPLLLISSLVMLCTGGCTPRQEIASSRSLHVGGRADFTISTAQDMGLASSGLLFAPVPSDVTTKPSGRFRYALFSDAAEGPVKRQAHIIFSELPAQQWQWEPETWAKPESLSYAKDRTAGKYWTLQLFPVFSSQDWFSTLWQANGRDIPDFWLAKRWSATPEDDVRIVAEYREPAPECMRERLQDAAGKKQQGVISVKGKDLWHNCKEEIEDFVSRADAAFIFDKAQSTPALENPPLTAMPSESPNMSKLVGKAQYQDTYSSGSSSQ